MRQQDRIVIHQPPALFAAQQRRQRLDLAIATLPPQLKESLLLTAFDGLSQLEAGEILGVSAKTVETRVYRARKLLAERLDATMRLAR